MRAEIITAPCSSKDFSAVSWNVLNQILDFCYTQKLLLTCLVSPQFTSFDWERHFCSRAVFLLRASTFRHSARPESGSLYAAKGLWVTPTTSLGVVAVWGLVAGCLFIYLFLNICRTERVLDPPAFPTPSLCIRHSCKPDCLKHL